MHTKLLATMYEYMITKNIKGLSSLFADNFVLYHMTGMKQNKQEYLRTVESGDITYYSSELDALIVEDEFHFIAQNRVSARVFGGGIHLWHLQLHITLTQDNRISVMRASTYYNNK